MIPDLIGRGTKAGQIQRCIRAAQDIDSTWNLVGGNDERLGYMPFQLGDFTAIMFEAMGEADGLKFLDVGAGPGSKMVIAQELFGLDVYGVEIDENMTLAGPFAKTGKLTCACALTSDIDYFSYDIIWLYRPFRDNDLQYKLEQKIRSDMKVGAILAGGAWECSPYLQYGDEDAQFDTIVDDWDYKRGAYKKVA